MKYKALALLSMITILSMLIGGCASATPAPEAPAAPAEQATAAPAAPAAPAAGGNKQIALLLPDMSMAFFAFVEKAVKAEAAKLGNIDIVTMDGQSQVPKQTADVEAAIAKKFDGIVISPIDAVAMAPAIKEAVDAGIPVVTVDRRVEDVATLAHVGADNVKGGEAQGGVIMSEFPDGAIVFELSGQAGSSPAIDRSKGLHNVIDGKSQVDLACSQEAGFTRDKGLTVTENCLGKTPNPDVIIAANDEEAFGAVEALKARSLDKVKVVGFDALPEALAMVRDGTLYATIDQFPDQQASQALDIVMAFIKDGTKPAEHDTFIVPKLITKENLNEAARIGEVSGEAPAAPAEPAADEFPFTLAPTESKTIVFIPKSTDVTYWLALKKGVEDEAAKLGYTTDYQGVPHEADIAQQVDLVKNIASTKPAGIVMAATDAKALAPAVEDAIKAGVPVVTVDSGVESKAPLSYFATDNVAGAAEGAKWLCNAVGGKGKVGDLGILAGSQSGIEREKGFAEWMASDCSGVTVVPVQYTGCDASKALNAANDILTANPDLVGFFGACAANGLGAAQAAKAAGREKDMKIVSFDPNPEIIPLFKSGAIGALIAQDPYNMGVKGVDTIDAIIKGGKVDRQTVLIPVVVITAENAEDYPQFLE